MKAIHNKADLPELLDAIMSVLRMHPLDAEDQEVVTTARNVIRRLEYAARFRFPVPASELTFVGGLVWSAWFWIWRTRSLTDVRCDVPVSVDGFGTRVSALAKTEDGKTLAVSFLPGRSETPAWRQVRYIYAGGVSRAVNADRYLIIGMDSSGYDVVEYDADFLRQLQETKWKHFLRVTELQKRFTAIDGGKEGVLWALQEL